MKAKTNHEIKIAIVVLSLALIVLGSWGLSSYYATDAIWKSIGFYQYPQVLFTAEKFYFSFGAFVVVLMVPVFALYTLATQPTVAHTHHHKA